MKTKLSQLYETDFNLWLEQTVNHLKKGNLQTLDLDNLIGSSVIVMQIINLK
jgi:hypothetical protein